MGSSSACWRVAVEGCVGLTEVLGAGVVVRAWVGLGFSGGVSPTLEKNGWRTIFLAGIGVQAVGVVLLWSLAFIPCLFNFDL